MDYFQSVVAEYLQRDPASFINTEFLLAHKNKATDPGPAEWLVDILNMNFRDRCAYLCEVSYSDKLQSLIKRLDDWSNNWPTVEKVVRERANLPDGWSIKVVLFVPENAIPGLRRKLSGLSGLRKFNEEPLITSLEATLPWRYNRWPESGRQARCKRPPPTIDDAKAAFKAEYAAWKGES